MNVLSVSLTAFSGFSVAAMAFAAALNSSSHEKTSKIIDFAGVSRLFIYCSHKGSNLGPND